MLSIPTSNALKKQSIKKKTVKFPLFLGCFTTSSLSEGDGPASRQTEHFTFLIYELTFTRRITVK